MEEKGGINMDKRILRARARSNLRNSWGVSIGVAVVASLLGGLIAGTSFLPELKYDFPLDHFPALQRYVDSWNQGLHIASLKLNFRAGIFGFAAFLMGGVLQMGFADFLLSSMMEKQLPLRICFPNLIISAPALPRTSCGDFMWPFGACCSSSPVLSKVTAMP